MYQTDSVHFGYKDVWNLKAALKNKKYSVEIFVLVLYELDWG